MLQTALSCWRPGGCKQRGCVACKCMRKSPMQDKANMCTTGLLEWYLWAPFAHKCALQLFTLQIVCPHAAQSPLRPTQDHHAKACVDPSLIITSVFAAKRPKAMMTNYNLMPAKAPRHLQNLIHLGQEEERTMQGHRRKDASCISSSFKALGWKRGKCQQPTAKAVASQGRTMKPCSCATPMHMQPALRHCVLDRKELYG